MAAIVITRVEAAGDLYEFACDEASVYTMDAEVWGSFVERATNGYRL